MAGRPRSARVGAWSRSAVLSDGCGVETGWWSRGAVSVEVGLGLAGPRGGHAQVGRVEAGPYVVAAAETGVQMRGEGSGLYVGDGATPSDRGVDRTAVDGVGDNEGVCQVLRVAEVEHRQHGAALIGSGSNQLGIMVVRSD
jgi:hypothetical protein